MTAKFPSTRRLAAAAAIAVLPFTAACANDPPVATAPPPAAVPPAAPPPAAVPPAGTTRPASPASTPPGSATSGTTTPLNPGAAGGLAQEELTGRIGQNVTVTGEVAEVLSPGAFTLGGDQIGENPVLVVNAKTPRGIEDGSRVRVTGQVIRFNVPGYKEDFDLDVVTNEFDDFDGDPAVRATSVSKL